MKRPAATNARTTSGTLQAVLVVDGRGDRLCLLDVLIAGSHVAEPGEFVKQKSADE